MGIATLNLHIANSIGYMPVKWHWSGIEVALLIIEYCEKLEVSKKFVISGQLLKSGTSIGANIHEAQNAESRADFIHKMKIAAKELEETKYWLRLCEQSKNLKTQNLFILIIVMIKEIWHY